MVCGSGMFGGVFDAWSTPTPLTSVFLSVVSIPGAGGITPFCKNDK